MTETHPAPRAPRPAASKRTDVDVLVIGAGLAGICMLARLKRSGFDAVGVEAGDGVGGTWYWNRYPGARVDGRSIDYSYSFDRGIQQDWSWSEWCASQPELEAYINFVTDRVGVRDLIRLSTRVTSMEWHAGTGKWYVDTDRGVRYRCSFVVGATGCLSAPLEPRIAGIRTFGGASLYTSRFPKEGFDFTGKRVAVIGTGASGVQIIPVIAGQVSHLYVFQRSAAFCRPSSNRPFAPGELDEIKARYDDIRAAERRAFGGAVYDDALQLAGPPPSRRILEETRAQRFARIDEIGWRAYLDWADVVYLRGGPSARDPRVVEANRAAADVYAELIRRTVKDPTTAAALVPHYPFGCKRGVVENGYFETFNRPNVTLVDLRRDPIRSVVPSGILTEQGDFALDVIVYATGFDAITGALSRIDITGTAGRPLADVWRTDGPVSMLGLQVAGFPNLFTITGPGSPSVRCSMVHAIEQHVDWIHDCLCYLRDHNHHVIEPTAEAQAAWTEHVASIVEGTILSSDSCDSWFLGANTPGKRRAFMVYLGGMPAYRKRCDEIRASGYPGFMIT